MHRNGRTRIGKLECDRGAILELQGTVVVILQDSLILAPVEMVAALPLRALYPEYDLTSNESIARKLNENNARSALICWRAAPSCADSCSTTAAFRTGIY